MKKVVLIGSLVASLATPIMCSAEGGYASIQYGTLTSEDSDMGNIGLMAATKVSDNISLEGIYTFTVNEDDLGGGVTLSTDSIGIYAAGKSEGDLYVKGKIGFSKVDFNMEFSGITISDDASGLSYGIGAGFNIGSGAIEVEYTKLPDLDTFQGIPMDASNEYLSVGYVVPF